MKVILLGGKGFIGEYLAKALDIACHQVIVVEREQNLKDSQFENAQILAVLTQPDPKIIRDVVLAARSFKTLKKILYTSTLLLYPESEKKSDEKVLPVPLTSYEKNKYDEELLLVSGLQKTAVKLCIARLGNVYGDVKNKGVINNIYDSVLKNLDLKILGDPKLKIRDYIFIEDAVSLLTFLISYNQKPQAEVFNICSAKGHSLNTVIEKIEKISGKKVNFKTGKGVSEKAINIGQNRKILKKSGYKMKYGLKSGLKKTYENYLMHRV